MRPRSTGRGPRRWGTAFRLKQPQFAQLVRYRIGQIGRDHTCEIGRRIGCPEIAPSLMRPARLKMGAHERRIERQAATLDTILAHDGFDGDDALGAPGRTP